MSSRKVRAILILIVLLAGLLPWPAAAQPPGKVLRGTEGEGPTLVSVLDHAMDFVARLWAKIGCTIDPSGRGKSALQGEIGCGIDPSGLCTPSPTAQGTSPAEGDIGCGIDPNGRCIQ